MSNMTARSLLLALALCATAVALQAPRQAFAHAEYESSTPARDEVVQQPPTQVEVIFTQEVVRRGEASTVRVFNEANTQVSEGSGVVDDVDRTRITATLTPNLPAGRYIVRWTTESDEDGDTDEGAFCFYIQTQPTAAQQAECATFAEEEDEPTATSAAVTATAPATSPTPAPSGDDDDGGAGGVIAAVVGVVIALVVVGGSLAWWMRRSAA